MSILGTYSFYGTYYNVIYNKEYRSNYSVKESMDIVWLLLCYLWLTCHICTQTQNKGLVCTFLSSRCIPNKHLIYIVCIEQWTICWLPRYILSLSCYFLIDLVEVRFCTGIYYVKLCIRIAQIPIKCSWVMPIGERNWMFYVFIPSCLL